VAARAPGTIESHDHCAATRPPRRVVGDQHRAGSVVQNRGRDAAERGLRRAVASVASERHEGGLFGDQLVKQQSDWRSLPQVWLGPAGRCDLSQRLIERLLCFTRESDLAETVPFDRGGVDDGAQRQLR